LNIVPDFSTTSNNGTFTNNTINPKNYFHVVSLTK
jgi:hypothetical protein